MEAFEALIQQKCNACVFVPFGDYPVCVRISLSRSVVTNMEPQQDYVTFSFKQAGLPAADQQMPHSKARRES